MPDNVFPTEKGEGLSDNKVLILCLGVLLIPMLFIALVLPFNPGDRAKLESLRRFAAEIPVYPEFKELDSAWVIKSDHGSFTVYYDVPAYSAGFETVKRFYTEALTPQGWSFAGEEESALERSVSFRKGKSSIIVTYKDGEYSDWDYAVSYWSRY
ncbi:MAG TPA: hypothetical protein VJ715_13500 [Pyrinomonadaceae bacterium]|nr:hypothetical protein [Pyrinomonadaceae bacterium]